MGIARAKAPPIIRALVATKVTMITSFANFGGSFIRESSNIGPDKTATESEARINVPGLELAKMVAATAVVAVKAVDAKFLKGFE